MMTTAHVIRLRRAASTTFDPFLPSQYAQTLGKLCQPTIAGHPVFPGYAASIASNPLTPSAVFSTL